MVVEHRRQQVVGGTDRMEVTGKVQIDVFHRNDLGIAAAGSTAFDTEDRSQGRFTQSDDRILADLAKSVRQADGRGRLSFAGRCRIDGGD